ncbi:MAG TPA: hypothetical protein VLC09_19150, partial [Polyangiaceae bacterium]|nr:hypothetical protein [Polyangiaceae bacterium]
RLTAIACSPRQACVLNANGGLTCWGDLSGTSPPMSGYTSIVNGGNVSGITSDGEVLTWGVTYPNCPAGQDCLADLPGPHQAAFSAFRPQRFYLDELGQVTSSRDNWTGDYPPYEGALPDARPKDTFSTLAVGPFICGLHADGTFLCWSDTGIGSDSAPLDDGTHTYALLDQADGLCGITREDGSIVRISGSTYDGPTGKGYRAIVTYTQTPPGDARRCGLTADGDLDCSASPYEQMVPAGAQLDKVCSGRSYVCGIRFDGKVSCWGREEGNFSDDPLILHIPDEIRAP